MRVPQTRGREYYFALELSRLLCAGCGSAAGGEAQFGGSAALEFRAGRGTVSKLGTGVWAWRRGSTDFSMAQE